MLAPGESRLLIFGNLPTAKAEQSCRWRLSESRALCSLKRSAAQQVSAEVPINSEMIRRSYPQKDSARQIGGRNDLSRSERLWPSRVQVVPSRTRLTCQDTESFAKLRDWREILRRGAHLRLRAQSLSATGQTLAPESLCSLVPLLLGFTEQACHQRWGSYSRLRRRGRA